MKPTKTDHRQGRLFETRLSEFLNRNNPIYRIAEFIDWEEIECEIEPLFESSNGRPGKPVQLIVGLIMLQEMFALSDEGVLDVWVENPYWQLFCGFDYMQWERPIDPTTLVKWRQRLGEGGLDMLLSHTVRAGREARIVTKSHLKQVTVDTTVMEKNISYPTDAKLYNRSRERLVKLAKRRGVKLRQSYARVCKHELRKAGQYAHARQMQRAKKSIKKIKVRLNRIVEEIKRKIAKNEELNEIFKEELEKAIKLLIQEKGSKNKIYSMHEPDVDCISKGKAHKKYEFGCKVSLVLTHKNGWALGMRALPGNPYDGHSLEESVKVAEKISGEDIKRIFADKGYRGHGITNKTVMISGQHRGVTKHIKKLINKRQAIEPHIGHMKREGQLGRNFLKGSIGDKLKAVLVGIGHNLRLLWNGIIKPGWVPRET